MSSPVRRSGRLAAKKNSEDDETISRSPSPARVASPARSRRTPVSTPTKPTARRRKPEDALPTESPKRGRVRSASRTVSESSEISVTSSQTPVRRSRRLSGLHADNVPDVASIDGRRSRSRSRTPTQSLADAKKVNTHGTMSPIAEMESDSQASPRRRIEFDGESGDEQLDSSPSKGGRGRESSRSPKKTPSLPKTATPEKQGLTKQAGSPKKATPQSSQKKGSPKKDVEVSVETVTSTRSSPRKTASQPVADSTPSGGQSPTSSDGRRVRRSSRTSHASKEPSDTSSRTIEEEIASLPKVEVVVEKNIINESSGEDITVEASQEVQTKGTPPPSKGAKVVVTISDSDSDSSEELNPIDKSPSKSAQGKQTPTKGRGALHRDSSTDDTEKSNEDGVTTAGELHRSPTKEGQTGTRVEASNAVSEEEKIKRMDEVLMELFPPSPQKAQSPAKKAEAQSPNKRAEILSGQENTNEVRTTSSAALSTTGGRSSGGAEKLDVTRTVDDAETSKASWPVIKSVEKLFGGRSRHSQAIQSQLSSAYAELCGTSVKIRGNASGEDELPDQLMKPNNSELVWQQLAYRNKQFFKSFKAAKDDMTSKVETKAKPAATDPGNDVDENEVTHDNAEDIDEPVDDEEETDIFNLRNEDLADLDQELDALRSDAEDEEGSEVLEAPKKKFRRSAVDDKFFNLAEMEEFLEAEDKKGGQASAVGIFDDAEEDDEKPADYRYTDFYVEQKKPKRQADLKRKAQSDKHVRFADEESDSALDEDEDEEDEDDEEDVEDEIEDEEESEDKRVLLGPVDRTEEKPQTSFEAQRETLRDKIEKFERENLQPRSWELSGEVRADEREPDTLLETYLDADFRAKTAPVIVADTTEKLESIIIQRIKDKAFDDVERKVKVDESLKPYRNEATDEVVRKSLTDVYEQEFQKAKGEIDRDEDNMDPAVKEIEKDMGSLFEKLDALAHFQYRPTAIKPEVKIVQNMPTMRVEEVGPMASSEPTEALMAPEEILKHAKAAPKATEERDATDKLRERRKKKKKQKIMAQKEIANGEKEQAPLKKKIKKKKVRSSGGNFFEKLQETTENEIREKTKKKKRKAIAGDGTKQSAAQYKL